MIENKNNVINTCRQISEILESLEKHIFLWDYHKEKQFKKFQSEFKKYSSILDELPDNWENMATGQYVLGKILGNPGILKKFFNQNREYLSREEKETVRFFLENPWFYSVFSVINLLNDGFLEIRDIATQQPLLINSENITRMHREGIRMFLCLLFNNGKCHQTYGIIHSFQGFDAADLHSFARMASYLFREKGDLSRAVGHKPLPFFLLDRYARAPVTVHKNKKIRYCFHSIKAPGFNPEEYPQILKIQEKKNLQKCALRGNREPFFPKILYFDKQKRLLHIMAPGIEGYRSIRSMLKNRYPLPAAPDWDCSPMMLSAIEGILGLKPPSASLEQAFETATDPGIEKELAKMNAMIKEMAAMRNRGKEYSLEKLAREHHIPMETARQMQKTLDQVDERLFIELSGGIKGYVPPPPETRMKFRESFRKNTLFTFNNSEKARSLLKINWPSNQGLDEIFKDVGIKLDDLPSLIEDLYFKLWKKKDYTVLMYTVYLLHHNGDSHRQVRDYCAEVLRIFWQVLVPSKDPALMEQFNREYNLFCYSVLHRLGLIELRGTVDTETAVSGKFRFRASDFFREWIQFHPE